VLNLSIPMSFLIQAETRSVLVEIGAVFIGQAFHMPLVHNDVEIRVDRSSSAASFSAR
jgi:hypothetical protein